MWGDWLQPAGLMALLGLIAKSVLDWRKDNRDQRSEPITHDTAIVAQASAAADIALRTAERLDGEVTRQAGEIVALRGELVMLRRWGPWYSDLESRWPIHRQGDSPPPPPGR